MCNLDAMYIASNSIDVHLHGSLNAPELENYARCLSLSPAFIESFLVKHEILRSYLKNYLMMDFESLLEEN